jgi:hypothetical protein
MGSHVRESPMYSRDQSFNAQSTVNFGGNGDDLLAENRLCQL